MITGDRRFGPGHPRYELQKSAVDAHVASQIFNQVVGPKGLLKSKVRCSRRMSSKLR